MPNKTVLVTGATDGIGRQTALELAQLGYEVLLHGRSEEKCIAAQNEIRELAENENIRYYIADFNQLSNIKKLADDIKNDYDSLDVLVNNAGVYRNEYTETADGYETTFAVNHLAYFLLTHELIDLLRKSESARIVNVSSIAHTRGKINFDDINAHNGYDAYPAYAQSKLANVMFTSALDRRLKNEEITVNSLHPGVIDTKLLREGFNMTTGASVKQGAATSVYLASSFEVEKISGKYFENSEVKDTAPPAKDEEAQERLWKLSEDMTGIKSEDYGL